MANYQYETSPRKLEPEHLPRKKTQQRKRTNINKKTKTKKQLKSHIKVVMNILAIFSVLFVISYRNSLINESFNRKEKLQSQLRVTQKENEQLQVSIENSQNLANVERIAKDRLGMQKLDNTQKVYVNLPKKDYVEPAVEEVIIETEQTWFDKIINMFFGT